MSTLLQDSTLHPVLGPHALGAPMSTLPQDSPAPALRPIPITGTPHTPCVGP